MYKLSVVIPTKNRYFYCKKAIEQVIKNTSSNTQIVIQDNSDDESIISSFCKNLGIDRIKYNYIQGVISFVDNFSYAIEICDGEYVCMIGDDDGVLCNIESVVKIMENEKLDAVIPAINVVYIWPSSNPFNKKFKDGYLRMGPFNKKSHFCNVKKALSKLLKNGFQDYLSTEVPRLYHGMVKKEKLNEVKSITNKYFGGLTPDMYMAVALSLVCQKVKYLNYPFTISGICPESGSANSASGAHTGKLIDAPHFKGHDYYEWYNLIPEFYSVETIWAETGIKALIDMNKSDLIKEISFEYLFSILIDKYPQFYKEIVEKVKALSINYKALSRITVKRKNSQVFSKIIRMITFNRIRSNKIYGIDDLEKVEKTVYKKFKKEKLL